MLTTVAQLPNFPAICVIELGILDGGGVDADFLGPGLNQPRGIIEGADAAADGEGHENLLGNAPDDIEHDRPAFVAGGDVEKNKFIGPVFLVTARDFDRIAGVAQIQEIDPLDNAASLHVQAGDDAFGKHRLIIPTRKKTEAPPAAAG